MHKKKLIGITANVYDFEEGKYTGLKYTGVFNDYPEAVLLGGGLPIILPPLKAKEDMLKQLESIDLLIVSGGADLQPFLYGEAPSPLLEKVIPERDDYEMELVKVAHEQGIPIFGICRGLQVINVAFGGTLYQDISNFKEDAAIHRHEKFDQEALHPVEIVENTLLHEILKEKNIITNSYHHQGIKKLAPGMKINAYAPDGFIEGIEKSSGPFLLAVQWHPEMMAKKEPAMLRLFRYLNDTNFG